MNKENTEILIKRYPILYNGVNQPITQNLMSFGFEHGDGWFNLVDTLSAILEDKNRKSDIPVAVACQVKEKYGTIRFYVDPTTDDSIYDIIDIFERLSECVCEECGAPSTLDRENGWIYNRCPVCKEKLNR